MSKFQAVNEYVQIQPLKEASKSTIIISKVAKEKTAKGKVLSVGEGRILLDGTRVEIPVKPGDIIFYNPHVLHEIECGKEKLYLINSTAIYGITR